MPKAPPDYRYKAGLEALAKEQLSSFFFARFVAFNLSNN